MTDPATLRALAAHQDAPAVRQALEDAARRIEALEAENARLAAWQSVFKTFHLNEIVRKKSGAQWRGRICGWYSTALTPEGYAVESRLEPGSVQIYPVAALELDPSFTPAAVKTMENPND